MLATAVRKNLEGATTSFTDAEDGKAFAALAGLQPRQFLASGMNAMPLDSAGVPFNGSYIVATGNLAADMYANITAESGGRLLATRLYEMTDDPGMKDMLAYLIARDTMHQNQWVAILKDLGDSEEAFDLHPIPDSFPNDVENQEFNYGFMSTNVEAESDPDQPWTSGESPDGKGEFEFINQIELDGQEISIPTPDPGTSNAPTPGDDD